MSARPHPSNSPAGLARPVPTAEVAPLVGELRSLGDLRLLRRLGSGGMSEVFLAYHAASGRTVAVKVLADHLAGDQSFVHRFAQEAYLSRKLSHRNLVRGLTCGRDPATRREFLVLELVDGPTAQEKLERQGRFSVAEAVRITIDIARALEYLHQADYVHRDIKPGNILLAPDGTAKLADLGVAKSLRDATVLTTLDQGIGTPYYMPWEQTLNAGLVDARSDLFALGATFYHLLTGKLPFPGESDEGIARLKDLGRYVPVTEHDAKLPPELDVILARLLARDPRQRYPSATELIDILNASCLASWAPPPDAVTESSIPEQAQAPTRPDLQAPRSGEDTPLNPSPIWLLRFRRPGGPLRRHRASTADIVRLYHEGLLPDDTLAARSSQRRFRPLRDYPEFRSLARKAASAPRARRKRPHRQPKQAVAQAPTRRQWLTVLNLGVTCLTGLISVGLSVTLLYWLLGAAH
jgi:eukaryotic-like serine/threonine-protein kinase